MVAWWHADHHVVGLAGTPSALGQCADSISAVCEGIGPTAVPCILHAMAHPMAVDGKGSDVPSAAAVQHGPVLAKLPSGCLVGKCESTSCVAVGSPCPASQPPTPSSHPNWSP